MISVHMRKMIYINVILQQMYIYQIIVKFIQFPEFGDSCVYYLISIFFAERNLNFSINLPYAECTLAIGTQEYFCQH